MVNPRDECSEPAFKLSESHCRLFFGFVLGTLFNIGERSAWQGVNFRGKCPHHSFDMTSIVRRCNRPPFEVNTVLLARTLEHVAAKLFGVVCMDSLHHAPDWPFCRNFVAG